MTRDLGVFGFTGALDHVVASEVGCDDLGVAALGELECDCPVEAADLENAPHQRRSGGRADELRGLRGHS